MHLTIGPGTNLGQYQLGDLLGKGGMAEVFSASDLRLNRSVALKVLSPTACRDADFRTRFLREAKVMAGLAHEHIVRVYDCGEEADRVYIAMEMVRGETLEQRLKREPRPPVAVCADVARALLGALAYVHDRNIVHRDVKPQNVLLGQNEVVKLVDFGLVKQETNSQVTRIGVTLGHPEYMSPEMLAGRPVSPAADLYSVGVVLYEMLTGVTPRQARRKAPAEAPADHPPAASSLRPEVSKRMDALLAKALAVNPPDRFESAKAFAHELAKAADPNRGHTHSATSRRRRRSAVSGSSRRHRRRHADGTSGKLDSGKGRSERKRHRSRSKQQRRQRRVVRAGLILAATGILCVFLGILLHQHFSPTPLPQPLSTIAAKAPQTGPSLTGDSAGLLASAEQRLQGRGVGIADLDTHRRAESAVTVLQVLLRSHPGQPLEKFLGADGRRRFFQCVNRADELCSQDLFHSLWVRGPGIDDELLMRGPASQAHWGRISTRIALLVSLPESERRDPNYWELLCRCCLRAGVRSAAVQARYQGLLVNIRSREAQRRPPLLPTDLMSLWKLEESTLFMPPTATSNLGQMVKLSWSPVWSRLKSGLTDARLAPRSPAPDVVIPVASATSGPPTELGGEDVQAMDKMEDEILKSRPQASPSPVREGAKVINPRRDRVAAPGLDRLEKVVASLRAGAPPTAAQMIEALNAVVQQLQLIRACAKVNDSAIEFMEPGRPGLFEAITGFNEVVARFEATAIADQNLISKLLEYADVLRQIGELPCDDASLHLVTGHALLLVTNFSAAEYQFIRAFSDPVQHPDGPSASDELTGLALAGLLKTIQARVSAARLVSGAPVYSIQLFDLLRLNLLTTALGQLPPATRTAWGIRDQMAEECKALRSQTDTSLAKF